MDSYSNSDEKTAGIYDEEYVERDYSTRQNDESEPEVSGYEQPFIGREKKAEDEEGGAGANRASRSRFKSAKKKKKVENFPVKLVFKILVVVVVFFNFKYIWNLMKDPISYTFYHTLFVLAICSGINFIGVWVLFYKSSFKRFYLALFAILGAFGYYFYVNYTNHSFLGVNMITSALVVISFLITINPKVNNYLRSIALLLAGAIGINLSGDKFALVWALMVSAGLILLFRVSKSNSKSNQKSDKKDSRARRNQKQTA